MDWPHPMGCLDRGRVSVLRLKTSRSYAGVVINHGSGGGPVKWRSKWSVWGKYTGGGVGRRVIGIGARSGAWVGVGLGRGGVDLGVVVIVGVIGRICAGVIDVMLGGGGACCLCRWKAVMLVNGGGAVLGRLLVVSCCRCLLSVVDLVLLVDLFLASAARFSCASLVNDGKDRLMTFHASSKGWSFVMLLGSDGVGAAGCVSWSSAAVKMSVASSRSCWTCSWNFWTSLCSGCC